jgi:hypothetical protein
VFAGNHDLFVAKFSADLKRCHWLNAYGGEGEEQGGGLAISSAGMVAMHGSFDSKSLALGPGGSARLTHSAPNAGAFTHTDGFAVFLNP